MFLGAYNQCNKQIQQFKLFWEGGGNFEGREVFDCSCLGVCVCVCVLR